MFIVSFMNTNFALVILIFSMLFSPELRAGGISGRAVVVRVDDIFLFVVFFGWWAKMAVNKELGLLKMTVLNRPIVVYTLVCFLATFIGILQGYLNVKGSFFYLLKYLEYFLLFFMVSNNLRSIKQAKIFVFFLILTCMLVSLHGYAQIPSGERLSAPFEGQGGEPNTLAGYLLLMMALILGLALSTEDKQHRLMFLGCFGFTVVPFLLTLSRGAWLGFLPMFLTFILMSKRHRIPLCVAFVSMLLLTPYVLPKKVHERVQETFVADRTYKVFGKRINLSESAGARIDAWQTAFRNVSRRPLFGYGVPAGNVVDNQYTRVLSETGIIGLITFLWLISRLFGAAGYSLRNTQGSVFAQGLSLGFIAGLIGLLTQSFTAATFIIVRIMEPFWFIAAIVVMLPDLSVMETLSAGKEYKSV